MELMVEEEEAKANQIKKIEHEKKEWNCEICLEEMEGT